MPGYAVVDGRLQVSFGDYADISSHLPHADCPMPESEKLANYVMRLLAMMNNGGWRLVQPNDQAEKGSLISIKEQLSLLPSYLDNIGEQLFVIRQSIAGIDSTQSNFSADFSLKIGSIVEKFVAIQADISAVKLQIDKIYIDKFNVEVSGVDIPNLSINLDDLIALLDEAMRREGDPDIGEPERVPILQDVADEAAIYNDNEVVLNIGNDAYFLKSKVVRA